jgi:hypothetical protein
MARNHANDGRIYRAVVVQTLDTGPVHTYTYGPYDTPSPAKGRITYWEGQAKNSRNRYRDPQYAFNVEGHIESAEVVWMREVVEESE